MDPEDQNRHLNKMARTIFDNMDLYMHYVTEDVGEKLMIYEVVLVNALARHIASSERVMDWREADYNSFQDFQVAYENHVFDKLKAVIRHMRAIREARKQKEGNAQ